MELLDWVIGFQLVSSVIILIGLVLTKGDFEAAVEAKKRRRKDD